MTLTTPVRHGILVLDYGSQYTLLIARRLRELGVYAEVHDPARLMHETLDLTHLPFKPIGVILSGGPDSVGEKGARTIPHWVTPASVPVLGICYGLQLLAHVHGGRVRAAAKREYGRAHMKRLAGSDTHPLMRGVPRDSVVWMSHGDDVEMLPDGWTQVALTEGGVLAVASHIEKPWFGLQFHPEVEHTEAGRAILENFAIGICRARPDWTAGTMVEEAVAKVREDVGPTARVLVACSGGVDSTVLAAVVEKALGPERVTAVFCDTGLMRKDEVTWVSNALRGMGLRDVRVIPARDHFMAGLAGVSDPEEKRRRIGRMFIEQFEIFARDDKKHAASLGLPGFSHLGQGTLYPDVIESAGHGAGAKVIKTHHNVGGLPDRLALKLCEPFRFLFKDEVRAIGRALGLAPELVDRHPFPGPGLAVRIPGELTAERVAILQEADDIFIKALREHGLYSKVWQAFAVLLPVQTVGVMGDNRTYESVLALRAVTSVDGMTADVGELPLEFLTNVAREIVQKVRGVNRVVYDVTSKPPATIEWE
ncbi:glutamine-hydrolyzing GMP synthase [bacterium]|nr:glutamine-hydrolyzing GMP synthase [bacterium]